ncbi:IS1 family transposase [Xenorhabdus mauleonii]
MREVCCSYSGHVNRFFSGKIFTQHIERYNFNLCIHIKRWVIKTILHI